MRFFNEARAANAIDHPGIVRIHDSGFTTSGAAYLTMEFLEGESLRTRLDRLEKLPPIDALRVARQLASALVAAHRKTVIHRDLKPDNIMLVPDPDLPGGERVKILDFGIAKIAESLSATPMHTRSDMLMGTPTYMAPEQCRGARSVTERSDVYSLAVIFYQLLAGRPPFVGDSVGELIAMHLMDPPPPLSAQVVGLEPGIVELVNRMLDKKPEQRPAMEGVFQELQRLELKLHAAAAAQSTAIESAPTVVNASVPRPEPATALLQQINQLAVPTQRRPVTPRLALPVVPAELTPPVATAGQPVTRQPGPGMRTVSVAASEWVQPGVSKPRSWRRVALTLGVLSGAALGMLTLLRSPAPEALPTVSLRTPKRAATSAAAAPRSAPPLTGPEAATAPIAVNNPPNSVAERDPAPEEKTTDSRLTAASSAYKAELYDKAIKAAEPLVKGYPLEARWIIGMAACKQQNTALADRTLKELAGLKNVDTESSRAEIKLACQQQRDLRKLNLRNPFDPSSTAEQYYTVKLYKQARSAAEQRVSQDPIKSWELIGRASCALKEPGKASEALTQLEANPTAPRASLEALKSACDSFGFAFRGGRFKHK